MNTCAPQCETNDARDNCSRSECAEGCLATKEYAVDRYPGTRLLRVVQNRVTGVLWQRQAYVPAPFASYQQCPLLPVDIFRTHVRNIARSQAKPHEQQDNRSIPPALRPIAPTRVDESRCLLGIKITRQGREPPFCNAWQYMVEAGLACTFGGQESQIYAKSSNDSFSHERGDNPVSAPE